MWNKFALIPKIVNVVTKMSENKKLKILYVITKSNWGGAQRYVYDLATSLPKDMLETVVALGGSEEKNNGSDFFKQHLNKAGIRTIVIKNFLRDISFKKEVLSFFELLKLFRKEKPDIVHLNSSKAGGLGALAARFAGIKKIIFTVHGWAFNEERPFFERIIIWCASYLTAIFVTDIIVLGQKEKGQALRMPLIRENKIHLITHGVIDKESLSRDEARHKLLKGYQVVLHPLWIGVIAELHPNKGLEYLIKAIAELPSPPLTAIIGEGQDRKKLEELIRDSELEKKVFLVGFKANAAVYLSAFDIFVLPSIKEGLPYSILEAGIRGVPVIATDVGNMREIIPTKKHGFVVQSKNPEKLAEAISIFMEDEERRKETGNTLQKRIEKQFSFKEMLDKTLLLYTEKIKNEQT